MTLLGWLSVAIVLHTTAAPQASSTEECALPPGQRGFGDMDTAFVAAERLLAVAKSSGNTPCGQSALRDADEVLVAVLASVERTDNEVGVRALRRRVDAFDISARTACEADSLALLQDAARAINLVRRRALASGAAHPIDALEVRAGKALLSCGMDEQAVRVLRAAITASDAAPYRRELDAADEGAEAHAAHLTLGKAYLASSDSAALDPDRRADTLERAAVAFRTALAIVPRSHDALVDGGLVQARLGRYDAAAGMYKRAIEIDPESLAARSNLAVVAVQLGQDAEAEAQLRRALEIAPRNAALWNNLGSILPGERIAEKLAAFERAVELDPEIVPALASLADNANAVGETERARVLLDRAIAALRAKREAPSTVTALRVKRATLVPRVFVDVGHGVATRRRFLADVRALTAEAAAQHAAGGAISVSLSDSTALDASATCLGYYLVYTGLSQREIKDALARMYCQLGAPTLAQISPHVAALGRNAAAPLVAGVELRRRAALAAAGAPVVDVLPAAQRLRVGFLSSFWKVSASRLPLHFMRILLTI